jgi:anthranilate phosphoribosyltransferase
MLLLNAAMAIVAAGIATDVAAGIAAAERAIDSGEAARTLERLRVASRG